MSVTQYIGARYVPLFADPLTWDITKAYEALTIVYYQGNSFTSRQAVPAGIDITNDTYWALTGNYNAQIEQYRAEVQTYDNRITANTTSNTTQDAQLAGTTSSGLKTLIETNATDIDALEGQMAGTSTSGLKTLIDGNASDIDALEGQMAGTSTSGLKTLIDGNASDIDTLEGQMAGTQSSGLKTMIDDLEAELADKHAVFIGDSFSTTTFVSDSDRWCYKIARALKLTPHIYAENGAGFVREGGSGHNFVELIQQASNSSTVPNSKVTHVFVLGGLNDLQDNYYTTAFGTGIRNTIDAAQTAFPNALVYICTCNSWSTGFSWNGSANMGNLWAEGAARQTIARYGEGVVHIPMAWSLGFDSSLYAGNPPHPNASGHTVMAAWILNEMKGAGLGNTVSSITLYDANNTSIGTMTLHVRDAYIEYAFNVSSTAPAQGVVHDDYHILGENAVNVRGVPLMTQTNVTGQLGSRVSTGVNYLGNGFGRGVNILS